MDRKDQILQASKSLFNRMGYSKTSVDDIAQSVGMQKSSLYYYYKSKEELFCSAYISDWGEIMEGFVKNAELESSPKDKILKYISQSLDHYRKVVLKHNISMKVIVETRNIFMEVFNEINMKSCNFFERTIREGIEKGLFMKVDAAKVARTILNIKTSIQYDNFMQFINQEPNKEGFKKISEEVLYTVTLMLDGISKK